MIDDIELLRLIENNARLSSAEIATMLGSSEDEVNSEIDRLKDDNIILGYNTVINWEKKAPDNCIGMIEVRIVTKAIATIAVISVEPLLSLILL